ARYALDFMLLMSAAAIVCIERAIALIAAHLRVRAIAYAIALLASYSIVTGFLLGFRGTENAFERKHPDLFHRIATSIGPSP
ncbi:MAG TPA: hypothetical protein VJZ00_25735, partial [Thermoanaerobaculia bacterium]|nr:hypothetical protein [Thermoanaerobaculia bacterium]